MDSFKCDYLPSRELKIIKDSPSGQRRIYKQSDNLNREIKYILNAKQMLGLLNTITTLNFSLEGSLNRIDGVYRPKDRKRK